MSDRGYRRSLHRRGASFALAWVAISLLGGCALFPKRAPVEVACQPERDMESTRVFASTQRAEPEPDFAGPVVVKEYGAMHPSDASPLPVPKTPAMEDEVPSVEEKKAAEIEEEAPTPPPEIPQAEEQPATPEPPQEEEKAATPEPQKEAMPAEEPSETPPADKKEKDIAHLPPPAAPEPPPSPEVQAMCGPEDRTCQTQLAKLLADPLHNWIKKKPTAEEKQSGARILAYRALTPRLACDDLKQGLRETEDMIGSPDGQSVNGDELEAVQLLSLAVKIELEAEIKKRC